MGGFYFFSLCKWGGRKDSNGREIKKKKDWEGRKDSKGREYNKKRQGGTDYDYTHRGIAFHM